MLKFFKNKFKSSTSPSEPQSPAPIDAESEATSPNVEEAPLANEAAVEAEPPVTQKPTSSVETTAPKQPEASWFGRLKKSLSKTRAGFSNGIANLFLGNKALDDDLMDEIETQLLMADVGLEATREIISSLTDQISRKTLKDPKAVFEALKLKMIEMLKPIEAPFELSSSRPHVVLVVGVNGAGKTTTLGKLCYQLKAQDTSVLLAAGDTFRAAAVEQLEAWAKRTDTPIVMQKKGNDSASVIYDALTAAKARSVDCLLADTAGRLHTRDNLMEELKKIKRVLKKIDPSAPHETLLVLDASIGQNALLQAKAFHKEIGITALAVTKLDGTAKGGIIFAIAKNLNLPIRFIGVGENIEDLRPFCASEFVEAIFS